MASQKKYDVISSEPSNPWLSGSSKLFTKEYFELLQDGVKDQGVVLHWINLYSLDLEGLKGVIASFNEVFPYVAVFVMPAYNDLVLIGTQEASQFDFQALSERLTVESVRNDLAKVGIKDSYEILAYFVLDDAAVDDLVEGVNPNTDNHPFVEFSAPKFLYSPVATNPWRVILDNLSPIASVLADPRPSAQKSALISVAESFRRSRLLTQIHFIERNIGEGIVEGEKALEIDSDNPYLAETVSRLYFEEGSSFLNQGNYAQAIKSFERSLELRETPEGYVNLGLSHEGVSNFQKAKETFEAAIELDDEFEVAYFELGAVLTEIGDLNGAIEVYGCVTELNPENTQALLSLGNLYILRSDFGRAEEYLKRVLKLDPTFEEARELLQAIP